MRMNGFSLIEEVVTYPMYDPVRDADYVVYRRPDGNRKLS